MIVGIGCDIVEIERIAKAMKSDGFMKRCFTAEEREYFLRHGSRAESAAAGFAAKEAVSKAFGTGISGFALCDIEILHEENGRPYVRLHGGAAELADKMHAKVHISMSHSRDNAVAYAVLDAE